MQINLSSKLTSPHCCEPEDYDMAMKRWSLDTLPLIPKSFEYKPIKQSYNQFKIIKALLLEQNFERIIIATDAGREGEVIARTILMKAGFLDKTRIMRFWTSQALVPEVVRSAMANLKPITDYDRLWRAGYYRQVSDWLIGMNCTRVLTVRLKDLFSVGRVQTAVLALLADRKKEREQFKYMDKYKSRLRKRNCKFLTDACQYIIQLSFQKFKSFISRC